MADTVFRVEVGAKIGVSTANLKKDIQGILDKMPARKIEVTLNTAKSKQNIKAELDKLKGKYSIPVELSAKGTGLNGTSGKNFKAALKTITSEINAQQAAKVTLHVDTAATQKAMLAELKKLNLGVTITPGNGNNGGGKQVDEYANYKRPPMQNLLRVSRLMLQAINTKLCRPKVSALCNKLSKFVMRIYGQQMLNSVELPKQILMQWSLAIKRYRSLLIS